MRGKRLTVEQCKQLEAYGIKGDPRKKVFSRKEHADNATAKGHKDRRQC